MKLNLLLLPLICFCLCFQTLFSIESSETSNTSQQALKVSKSTSKQAEQVIEVFVQEGCSYCERAKKFLKDLQSEYPTIRVIERDISKDPAALADLKTIAATSGVELIAVPVFVVNGQVIVGYDSESTGQMIRNILGDHSQVPDHSTELDRKVRIPILGEIDVKDYDLPAFTIIIGLIDGFNPCAMWVLLFLLALLIPFKSRRKMFLIAGTFVLVSGIVYFSFMTAWLNFFFLLGSGRSIQIILGLVALFVGIVHVKDYFAFRKGLTLSIPESAKPWIGKQIRKILTAENMLTTMIAVIVLAFLVNGVELLCTAGLPAIYTQVLSNHALPGWQYYSYLILYNIAYMLDDAIVVFMAIITLNPQRLTVRGGRLLKLVSGLVMIGLAALMLFKPEWLSLKF